MEADNAMAKSWLVEVSTDISWGFQKQSSLVLTKYASTGTVSTGPVAIFLEGMGV